MAEAIIPLRLRAHNPEPCPRLTGNPLDAAGPMLRPVRRPDGLTGIPRP